MLHSVPGQAEPCTCKISTKSGVLNSDSLCYINGVSDTQAPPPSCCEIDLQNDLCTYSITQLPEYRHVLDLEPLPFSDRKEASPELRGCKGPRQSQSLPVGWRGLCPCQRYSFSSPSFFRASLLCPSGMPFGDILTLTQGGRGSLS